VTSRNRMTKKLRDRAKMFEQEGAEVVDFVFPRRGHPRIKIRAKGREATVVVSGTESDRRARKNEQARVRRFVETGVLR